VGCCEEWGCGASPRDCLLPVLLAGAITITMHCLIAPAANRYLVLFAMRQAHKLAYLSRFRAVEFNYICREWKNANVYRKEKGLNGVICFTRKQTLGVVYLVVVFNYLLFL